MELLSFSYDTTHTSEDDEWHLEPIHLSHLNLIVGKNATGKSRALVVISAFAKMIKVGNEIYIGEFNFHFQDGTDIISYKKTNRQGSIFTEDLFINGRCYAKRSGNSAELFSIKENKWQTISPPDNRLLIHVRRDVEEYPYFEKIITWAENVQTFNFGHVHVSSFIEGQEAIPASIENIPQLIEKMSPGQKANLLKTFNSIGYEVSEMNTQKNENGPILYIKEEKINKKVVQRLISQGMFRALALLIFIHHLLDENKASLIIIDDLCEGLDYERATKLGKLLYGDLLPKNVQLVATSNDSFLMDVVDIKYWNVIQRKGTRIKSLNYTENKPVFEHFKFSGLSNFDFFSSDFIESRSSQK